MKGDSVGCFVPGRPDRKLLHSLEMPSVRASRESRESADLIRSKWSTLDFARVEENFAERGQARAGSSSDVRGGGEHVFSSAGEQRSGGFEVLV